MLLGELETIGQIELLDGLEFAIDVRVVALAAAPGIGSSRNGFPRGDRTLDAELKTRGRRNPGLEFNDLILPQHGEWC